MSPSGPRVLLVTSVGASPAAVTPVLAALEVAGLAVRAIDVGRVGARVEGAFDRMIRALVGELAERRLMRELGTFPPDVVVAFDPGTTSALTVARDQATKPAPVLAVIDSLAPESEWATTDADRYLVVDDEAAVALTDHGVEAERVMAVGAVAEAAFVRAAAEPRAALRSRHKLGGVVVLVEVAGLGYDMTSQIALQLSLAEANPTYLFDAGDDSDAATALRRQVPTLGMRAKLFGDTDDAPLYWRCADVVIARPRPETVARTLILGAKLVALLPEDRSGHELAAALELRGRAAAASNALLLTSALEQLLKAPAPGDNAVVDGAGNVADIAWVVGKERSAVIDERHAAARQATRARVRAASEAAAAAERVTSAAGGLEDLSGGTMADFATAADMPDPGEIARLRAEINARIGQVSKTVFAAREAAEQWEGRRDKAAKKGDAELAREAERNGDAERARMHQALAELSQLQSELKDLDRAATAAAMGAPPRSSRPVEPPPPRRPAGPSVDDLLEQMKRDQRGGTSTSSSSSRGSSSSDGSSSGSSRKGRRGKKKSKADTTVDDELAALKRKMAAKKGKGK